MKIGILGSAPSSVRLAPFGDPSWTLFGCSPGVYAVAPRVDVWFELHRWEPGIIGRADTQKPWFSPEYVAWMGKQKLVWMYDKVPEIPNSAKFPYQNLVDKYGSYFFTSSIAWMLACAIEDILENRKKADRNPDETDHIGLWGVDMAANEEYADQRPGCQFFIQLAQSLGIQVYVPPESDLMAAPLLYGISESSHMVIKLTARRNELSSRLNNAQAGLANLQQQVSFLQGALDDLDYMFKTWTARGDTHVVDFKGILIPHVDAQVVPIKQSRVDKAYVDAYSRVSPDGSYTKADGTIAWITSGDNADYPEIVSDPMSRN